MTNRDHARTHAIRNAESEIRGKLPGRRRMIGGGLGFVLFSIVGITVAAIWYPSTGSKMFAAFPWEQLLFLGLLAGVDFVLGGLRYSIFFNGGALPRISLWRCMCANWANMLMGVLTPFQTGGGPAQIYMLWREGARVSEAFLVSLLTFCATLVFFLVASGASMFLLSAGVFEASLLSAVQVCFVVIAVMALVVLAMLIFPGKGFLLVRGLAVGIARLLPATRPRMDRFVFRMERGVNVFRHALTQLVRRHPGTLPIMVLLTMALFFNKYFIGFVIVQALESTIPFDTFMGLQVLQHLIIYYAPTPGASGLAGISATWLLSDFLSPEKMVTYIVVWRFFTTLLGALLGIGVVVAALRAPVSALRKRTGGAAESMPSEAS